MRLFYVPTQKKTGKPICVLNKPEFLKTDKGTGKTWQSFDFVGSVSGYGNITMEWIPSQKEDFGKSCVLTVENFRLGNIDESKKEIRNWFCKGNFKREGLENTPIVVTDHKGENRQNAQRVTYQNVGFSLALNNAIPKEKQSGASTILRVFEE